MCSSLNIKPSNALPDVTSVLQLLPRHQAPVPEPDAPSSAVVVPPSTVLQQVRLNDGYTAVVFYKHDDASSTQLHGLPLNEFVATANLPAEAIWSSPAEPQTFWTARLFVCFAATDCSLSMDQVGCLSQQRSSPPSIDSPQSVPVSNQAVNNRAASKVVVA